MSFHDEHRDSREADAAGAAGVRPRRSTKQPFKFFIMEININVNLGITEEARRTAAQICAALLQGREMKQELPATATPAPAQSSASASPQEQREETAAQATAPAPAPAPAAESSPSASPQEQREETAPATAEAPEAPATAEAPAGFKLNPNTPPPADYEGPLSDIDLRGHMNFVFQRVIGEDWETKVKEDPDAKKKQRQTTAAFKSIARDLGADKPTALALKDRERFLELIRNICTGEDGNIQALPF